MTYYYIKLIKVNYDSETPKETSEEYEVDCGTYMDIESIASGKVSKVEL